MAKKVTKKPSKKAPVKETKKSKSAPEPKTTKKKPVPAKDTKVAKSVVAEVVYPDEDKGSEDLDIEASLAPLGVSKEDKSRALSPTDPMALYLAEIRRYPLLTKEQEVELATRYFETKDPAAAQALVTANLRFVVKVAAEYTKFGAKLIDLVQEGNVGLMHAVREFNPYKGARLITYAVWWIRGYIQEYLMKQYSVVRIGTTQNQRKLFYQLQKEKDKLDAMGQTPTLSLLSSRLGISEEEIQDMSNRMSGRDVSLNQPLDDDSKSTLMDIQKSSDNEPLDEKLAISEELALLKDKIEEIRPKLSEKETIILENRLLADEPMTLQEIGEKYGITREAVRQMEVRVLKKIKQLFDEAHQG